MGNNGYNDTLFPTEGCLICGYQGDLVRHEVFQGPNRLKSKKYGCWVNLCPRCHMELHAQPSGYKWLKAVTQEKAMEVHGWTEEEFRNVFGKSYI